MKKRITKLLAGIVVLLLNYSLVNAQSTTVTWLMSAATTNTPNVTSGTGWTASNQSIVLGGTIATDYANAVLADGTTKAQRSKGSGLANGALPAATDFANYLEYTVTADANTSLTVSAVSMDLGGGGSTSNVRADIYYSNDGFTTKTKLNASLLSLQNNSSSPYVTSVSYTPTVTVPANGTFKVRVFPSLTASSTSKYIVNSNVKITFTATALSVPRISAFSAAGINATVNESAKTITATLPYGTDITKITPTVTLAGTATGYTPTGEKDFTNPVIYKAGSATDTASYTVTLTVPATTPTPTIALSTGTATQTVKANSAITNIVYNLTNVNETTGATATGLPTGLSGQFVKTGTYAGTYTISGTVDAGVSPAAFPFTVTASPIDAGYTGSSITSGGTINTKLSTAATILYLASDTVTTTGDAFYRQLLQNNNYVVIKRANQASAPANYNGIDLIFLHESLTGGDAVASGSNELKSIKSVDKPILNTKTFLYTAGGTPRWNWGTPSNGGAPKGVKISQPSHPIFTTGITVTDSLYIYKTKTNRNMQPTTGEIIGGYSLAIAPGGMVIHEIPATVRVGVSSTSKYILISLLNGKYHDLSADGIQLLNNALDYLLNQPAYTPPSVPSLNISTFTVASVSATIDHTAKTISATVAPATAVTALLPTIVLDGVGTFVTPVSAQNFTSAVNYTVSDGINSKVYAATVTVAPSLNITSFNVGGVDATIDNTAKTVVAHLPIGTDITALQPTIVLAGSGAAVSPNSGVAQDFTNPVNYVVSYGSFTNTYAVTVSADVATKINETNSSAVSVQGSFIKNPNQERITVYNAVGRVVASSTSDIQLNDASKGAYIVKTASGKNIKFVVTK